MKNITKWLFLCLFLLTKGTTVRAQFTTLMLEAKVWDSGSVKCKPPYEQSISIYLTAYGGPGSPKSDSVIYYFDADDGFVYHERDLLRTKVTTTSGLKIKEIYHAYKTSGTYNAVIAVTSITTGATDTVRLPTVIFSDSCTTFCRKIIQ